MRLLYFINSITDSGGMERIVIDKINYLSGVEGCHVSLAYYGTMYDKSFFAIDNRITLKPMGKQSMGASLTLKLRSLVRVSQKVRKIIDDVQPDVIINANTILVSWLLPFIRRSIPKIVELHFSYAGMKIISNEMYGNSWLKKKFNYRLRKWGYAKYDKCVLLTGEDLRDWNFKNAIVIPNFTNISPVEYNLLEKRKTVVNVGRLVFQKNQKMLIDAWNIVNQKAPDWSLEIWGYGELHDDLTKQIYELGLEGKVRLMGVSHHIENVYHYASFFVLSSRYEGQPLVMIEALLSSLPCVCFAVNGVRGTIRNDYNGYIVEDMTHNALAEGILKMINSNHNAEMSHNARKSAKVFEKEIIMQKWINLFDEIIK